MHREAAAAMAGLAAGGVHMADPVVAEAAGSGARNCAKIADFDGAGRVEPLPRRCFLGRLMILAVIFLAMLNLRRNSLFN